MTDNGGNTGSSTGPWDVLMYLIRTSPTIVVVGAAIAGVVYVVTELQDERNQALKELVEARQQISKEQTESREKIEAAERRAAEMEAEAGKRMREAEKRESEARANALFEVQNFLLETSSKVQGLVGGQLESMVELESIRDQSAAKLRAQIAELETQRQKVQGELSAARAELRVSRVGFSMDGLENSVNDDIFVVDKAIEALIDSFEADDQAAVQVIEQRLSQRKNPRLTAAAEYALAIKTREEDWVKRFTATLRQLANETELDMFRTMFDCCSIPEIVWISVFPTISKIIVDPAIDVAQKEGLLRFFNQREDFRTRPLLSDKQVAENELSWQLLSFAIDTIRARQIDTREGFPVYGTLLLLEAFEPAAAYVWGYHLANDDEVRDQTRSSAANYVEQLADWLDLDDGGPSREMIDFWTSDDLVSIHDRYPQVGTIALPR